MIFKIEINGFKSIKRLDLELKPINVLLGGNGAGKSNFISVFSLIRNIYNKNLQNYVQRKGGPDSILHFGRKNTESIDINIFFRRGKHENRYNVTLQAGQENLFIRNVETAFYSGGRWHKQKFESNVLESEFKYIHTGQAYYVNNRLQEFDVYHFHDTSDTSPMKLFSDVNDNHYLRRDGSNIAAFLFFLQEKHPKNFKRIELTISSIAPFFDHFSLEPSRLNESKIQLEWREVGHPDNYFNAYHLSDGTLRFICLTTLLMQPHPPATIIIDEPELGLHPVAINKLCSLVRKASEKTQIILSTQSVNLIDNFDPDDIILADRKDDGSEFRRLQKSELTDWLQEYTLGDLWGKNKFGAQPYNI